MDDIGTRIRTVVGWLAWIAIAILIALGGAGVIAAMDHLPESGARPELTHDADAAATAQMNRANGRLEALATQVEAFGETARLALTQVISGDLDALAATIADGNAQVVAVEAAAASLRSDVAGVPGVGEDAELRLSPPVMDRYSALTTTVDLTSGLASSWASFASRADDAGRIMTLLVQHDDRAGAAAKAGAAGHYRVALSRLDEADATMAEAMAIRDRLAPTTDVTTLSRWLELNAAYDAALRDLYQSLIDADGRVSREVRAAFAAEQEARAALPGDTRGLVVIMAEVAQGGLNQAVISIEEARGALDDALLEQLQLQASDEPSG